MESSLPSFDLNFPRAYGDIEASAFFKQKADDFYVKEELGFTPSGSGEHVFLLIEKSQENSQFIANKIAGLADVSSRDVSYAGMKDKHAVTQQWFSVYLPKGDEPGWLELETKNIRLLNATRHNKKLRRGDHDSNFFRIRLRNIQQENISVNDIQQRLAMIAEKGFPNYFGEQRFGYHGQNLQDAHVLLTEMMSAKTRKRGGRVKQQGFKSRLLVSAARAWLFNQVLAERVRRDNWNQVLVGDVDEQPTACLWGRGRSIVSKDVRRLEQDLIAGSEELQTWTHFLEHCGLSQERRCLIAQPKQLEPTMDGSDLILQFSLAAGEYATSLLREVCLLK